MDINKTFAAKGYIVFDEATDWPKLSKAERKQKRDEFESEFKRLYEKLINKVHAE